MDEPLTHHIIPGHDIGNGNSHHQSGGCCHNGYEQASPQGGIIIFFGEKPDVILHGKALYLGGKKASRDQGPEGIQEKNTHEPHHQNLDPEPQIQLFPSLYHEITSWVSAS